MAILKKGPKWATTQTSRETNSASTPAQCRQPAPDRASGYRPAHSETILIAPAFLFSGRIG